MPFTRRIRRTTPLSHHNLTKPITHEHAIHNNPRSNQILTADPNRSHTHDPLAYNHHQSNDQSLLACGAGQSTGEGACEGGARTGERHRRYRIGPDLAVPQIHSASNWHGDRSASRIMNS